MVFEFVVLPLLLAAGKDEVPPHFNYIPATFENSSLSMDCTGSPPYETIDCTFTYALVSAPDDAKVKKAITEAAALTGTDFTKFRQAVCPKMQDVARRTGLTPGQKAAEDEVRDMLGAMCRCSDEHCFVAVMTKYTELNERTCHVYSDTFRKTLRRTGLNRWVATSGPDGMCANVEVSTLERAPDAKYGFEWTYTWVRASADTSQELCKPLAVDLNKPHVYRWDAPREFVASCHRLTFGF